MRSSRAMRVSAAGLLFGLVVPCQVAIAEVGTGVTSKAPPAPRAVVRTIKIGTTERTFRLYVPDAVARRGTPAPLVIVLHGATGHSEQVERYMGFNAVADREGLVVAYPQGVRNAWNDDRPSDLPRATTKVEPDDAGFLKALARHLVKSRTADAARIYLAGLSNGGFMIARLACEGTDVFAGFAILIASIPMFYAERCWPAQPLPVLILNGSEDRLAPMQGYPGLNRAIDARQPSRATMAVRDHAAFWAARNRCKTFSEQRLDDLDPKDGSEIVRTDWSGCAPGGAVSFYLVEGGGHQTPSPRVGLLDQVIGAFLGHRNRDAETAELLWDFFKRHQR